MSRFRLRVVGAAFVLLWPILSIAQEPESAGDLSWPPSVDGLAFLWEDGGASNTIPTDGPVDQLCRLIPRGQGKLNRFWAMDVAEGAFHAEPMMNASVVDGLRESNQLTLEVVVTPSRDDYARPAHIVSYGTNADDWNFVLAQQQEAFFFGIEGRAGRIPLLEIGRAAEGRPQHIVVSVADNVVRVHLDGQQVSSYPVQTDLSAWTEGQLSFGRASDGSADWAGSIEGVALYNRALTRGEAARHHQAYARRLTGRGPLPVLAVEARLIEKRAIPRVTAYPNTLVVFDYRVTALIEGTYEEEKILVTHWGNLNRQRQRATEDLRVGGAYRLKLEPFDEHPELAALQIVTNEEDFHLPLFYAVSDPVPQ